MTYISTKNLSEIIELQKLLNECLYPSNLDNTCVDGIVVERPLVSFLH